MVDSVREEDYELNRILQTQGLPVVNLYIRQIERLPGWTENRRYFITDKEGVILSEVCEVSIECSPAVKLFGQPALLVRKSDLRMDPALYNWFRSLENGKPYYPLTRADTRWKTDPYTHTQLREQGLL